MKLRLALASMLLVGLACGRKPAPPVPAAAPQPQAPAPAAPKKAAVPWTWRPLGNLVVIEGEIPEKADLVLSGPSIFETRKAGPGPLRWEIIRPPEGERAELRTSAGKVLARFTFAKSLIPKVPGTEDAPTEADTPAEEPKDAPPPAEAPPTAKVDPKRVAEFELPHPRPFPQGSLATPGSVLLLPPAPVASRLTARLDLPGPRKPPATLPAPGTPAPRPDIHPPAFRPGLPGPPWPGAGEALNLARGPRSGKQLVLSFDGGSSAEVAEEILDTLKARKVRTTIFLTGSFVQKYPALVRRMAAEGHELGNHTMTHPHFAPAGKRDPRWTRERVQRELLEADQALFALLGRPMDPLWRAPYGEQNAEIREWAEELGYRHVGWSEGADTLDWATAADRRLYHSGTAILDRLYHRLARNGEGMIVLMHLGSARPQEDRPARSLGAFMDRAAKDGWRFVPVGSFVRELGKPAWDPAGRIAMFSPGRGGGSHR